jgi:hypothetical protein
MHSAGLYCLLALRTTLNVYLMLGDHDLRLGNIENLPLQNGSDGNMPHITTTATLLRHRMLDDDIRMAHGL